MAAKDPERGLFSAAFYTNFIARNSSKPILIVKYKYSKKKVLKADKDIIKENKQKADNIYRTCYPE
ncbi:hypothetical protein CLFO_03070 [Clostridium formicaceticum]|uniref:Uncharacterized protein n=1 Tax=Clostridium formicaceticum TaxID=1497 RepID=A0AAC9RH76_9CLOT|nr:hypothetical protein BJL90_07065 [Clostridium formicaceticum]ARE85991.1 hypothetical protein CLFO_03070 [Clostridium formicaceticum]